MPCSRLKAAATGRGRFTPEAVAPEWGRCRLFGLVKDALEKRIFGVDKAEKAATSPLRRHEP